MRRSSLEWLCFFIAVVQRGSSLAAHRHISHGTDLRHQVKQMTSMAKLLGRALH
jgi:hypothetical protein